MKKFMKKIWHYYLMDKTIFWHWLLVKSKTEDAEELNKFLRFVYAVLFPMDYIKFSLRRNGTWNSYNPETNVWRIYGMRYSGDLFKHLAAGDDWFRIIKREDGIVTLERAHITSPMTIEIKVYQEDWMPGFAFFAHNKKHPSTQEGKAHIGINIGGLLGVVKEKDIEVKELPYVIAESIMHEVIHALEEWAKVEFNEEKVEALIEKYIKETNEKKLDYTETI